MRRLAVLLVIHWCGILAFSQSPTNNFGTQQASPRRPANPRQQFDFNGHRTRQVTPSTPFWKMDFSSLDSAQNQMNARGNAGQLSHAPAINTASLFAMVRPAPSILPSPLLPSPLPMAKLEPIPTQWPNARFELIPTTWPDLKIQRAESSPIVPSK